MKTSNVKKTHCTIFFSFLLKNLTQRNIAPSKTCVLHRKFKLLYRDVKKDKQEIVLFLLKSILTTYHLKHLTME